MPFNYCGFDRNYLKFEVAIGKNHKKQKLWLVLEIGYF
jgi:hypothetical protein